MILNGKVPSIIACIRALTTYADGMNLGVSGLCQPQECCVVYRASWVGSCIVCMLAIWLRLSYSQQCCKQEGSETE